MHEIHFENHEDFGAMRVEFVCDGTKTHLGVFFRDDLEELSAAFMVAADDIREHINKLKQEAQS